MKLEAGRRLWKGGSLFAILAALANLRAGAMPLERHPPTLSSRPPESHLGEVTWSWSFLRNSDLQPATSSTTDAPTPEQIGAEIPPLDMGADYSV